MFPNPSQLTESKLPFLRDGLGSLYLDCWPGQMRQLSREQLAGYLVREADGESTGIEAGFCSGGGLAQ